MIRIEYLKEIILLIRWDADNYLPDRKKEMEIFRRIQDILCKEQKEKGENEYETE